MYLGIKSLWRAQTRSVCIKELSLGPVPREHHSNLRRWMSSSAQNHDYSGDKAHTDEQHETKTPKKTPKSRSNKTRYIIKRAMKLRRSNPELRRKPPAFTLIKPALRSPSWYETRRSFRKHSQSVDRQHLHDLFIQAYDKPNDDWGSTLLFMLEHTPPANELFSLKVAIGREASYEARKALSSLDNNIGQIERRHESVIRFEESFPDGEILVINISGTETAVRDSLRDILNVAGKVTAVRVNKADLMKKLRDIWKDKIPDHPLSLDGDDGETAPSDTTMTVQSDPASQLGTLAPPSRYKHYMLKERADHIPQPAEWTKVSFDEYVAALVYGVLPTHLARELYPKGPSHQKTVVSLLVDIFVSKHTRDAVSVSALKMALAFMTARDPVFRPEVRRIIARAEELNLPLDAETFGLLLASVSKVGDINNFNSVLRLMVRRRFHVQSRAWYAFLELTQHAKAKRIILAKMEARGLQNIPVFSVGMARQLALLDVNLRRPYKDPKDMEEPGIVQLIETYDRYGTGGKAWLNAATLNKLLDALCRRGRLYQCHALLDYVHTTDRATTTPEAPGCGPDACTLNTMLTHTRRTFDQAALLRSMRGRWPWVKPDADTYNLLFSIAWARRRPNTLRVIWRYALLSRCLSPKIRHKVTTLLRDDYYRNLSNRRFLLMVWGDVIVGRAELAEEGEEDEPEKLVEGKEEEEGEEEANQAFAAMEKQVLKDSPPPPPPPNQNGGRRLMAYLEERHLALAEGKRPGFYFDIKLQEAYEMDLEIHRLIKAGTMITPAMRKQLTVAIPLKEIQEASF